MLGLASLVKPGVRFSKAAKLFGPEKPFVELSSACFGKLI